MSFPKEAHVARGSLTIEHVMPRLLEGALASRGLCLTSFKAEHERGQVLNTLGNLTLVNGRLNPKLFQRAVV